MTKIMPVTEQCAVCGARSERWALLSTNTLGGPSDLDGRPAPMARDTMYSWVSECPECGYASARVSDPPGAVTREWLRSDEYRGLGGMVFGGSGRPVQLAERFYRQHLCRLKNGDTEGAFYAVLYAAWSCDNGNDTEEDARACRKEALRILENIHTETDADKERFLLIKADLLRRAGMFDELAAEYGTFRTGRPDIDDVIAFQLQKAKEKDTDCYVRATFERRR